MQKTNIIATLIAGAALGALIAGGTLSRERAAHFWKGTEPIQEEGISVLVLGRVAEGQGGKWHRAPELVDTIVLFYYSPETGTVNLISLPRDLYGDFGGGYFKLNEVYRRGAVEEFLKKLSEITSVATNKYVVVDAGVIERGIDALGGIDITLESPVTDSVSGFRLEPGNHHLNGEDTVWLLRNRYAPEGDFFREKNQQAVIEAAARRYRSLGAVEKTKFLLRMAPELRNTESNFSIGEIAPSIGSINLTFNGIVLDFGTGLIKSTYTSVLFPAFSETSSDAGSTSTKDIDNEAGVSTSAITPSGAYILIPSEGINNYTAIREFIAEKIK